MVSIYTHLSPHHVDETLAVGLLCHAFSKLDISYEVKTVQRDTIIKTGIIVDFSPSDVDTFIHLICDVKKGILLFDHHEYNQESCSFGQVVEYLDGNSLICSNLGAYLKTHYVELVNSIDHGVKYEVDLIYKPLINLIPFEVLIQHYASLFNEIERQLDDAYLFASCINNMVWKDNVRSSEFYTPVYYTASKIPAQPYLNEYGMSEPYLIITPKVESLFGKHRYVIIKRGSDKYPSFKNCEEYKIIVQTPAYVEVEFVSTVDQELITKLFSGIRVKEEEQ